MRAGVDLNVNVVEREACEVEDALGHWVLAGHFTMRPAEYAAVLVRLVAHGGPTSVRDAARLLIPGLLTEVCSGG